MSDTSPSVCIGGVRSRALFAWLLLLFGGHVVACASSDAASNSQAGDSGTAPAPSATVPGASEPSSPALSSLTGSVSLVLTDKPTPPLPADFSTEPAVPSGWPARFHVFTSTKLEYEYAATSPASVRRDIHFLVSGTTDVAGVCALVQINLFDLRAAFDCTSSENLIVYGPTGSETRFATLDIRAYDCASKPDTVVGKYQGGFGSEQGDAIFNGSLGMSSCGAQGRTVMSIHHVNWLAGTPNNDPLYFSAEGTADLPSIAAAAVPVAPSGTGGGGFTPGGSPGATCACGSGGGQGPGAACPPGAQSCSDGAHCCPAGAHFYQNGKCYSTLDSACKDNGGSCPIYCY